jgi:hypothetical protein
MAVSYRPWHSSGIPPFLLPLLAQATFNSPFFSLFKRDPTFSAGSKRNGGIPEECQGRYDTAIFTTLNRVCEDCYNLYKEPEVHGLCRSGCFSTSYFQRCLQALLLEEDEYLELIQIIGK